MSIKKVALPQRIVDADGRPTLEFLETWERLINNEATNLGTPGKVLRDAAIADQKADAAILAADTAQTNSTTTPTSALAVSTSVASVRGSGGFQDFVTTGLATITVSGGTPPYTAAAVKTSGTTLTPVFAGLPLAADGTFTVGFSAASGGDALAQYRIDVTDSAGSPLTESVLLGALIIRIDGVGA